MDIFVSWWMRTFLCCVGGNLLTWYMTNWIVILIQLDVIRPCVSPVNLLFHAWLTYWDPGLRVNDDIFVWHRCRCTLEHIWFLCGQNIVFWWIIFENMSFFSPIYIYRDIEWYETHLNSSPLDKMATILQTTFSNAFASMKSFVFWFKFHWSLFLRVQLTISQHWFR